MSQVVTQLAMSLDGFVADSSDSVDQVFAWYGAGSVTVAMPGDHRTLHVADASARLLQDLYGGIGAVVSGRRTFDLTNGWRRGNHPVGAPVFVVTRQPPDGWHSEGVPLTFITDGVKSAIDHAKVAAGDKVVFVGSADIARQCLDEGLLDELRIDLVPVLLGAGVSLFDDRPMRAQTLGGPEVTQGTGVTHLRYRLEP